MSKLGIRLDSRTHRILWIANLDNKDGNTWEFDLIPTWWKHKEQFRVGKFIYAIED
jgi:hypothetical protein